MGEENTRETKKTNQENREKGEIRQMSEYKIIKSYREDDSLRHSFCQLAHKTFYLDFENWYQNGFWTEQYNPYSILKDGEVIANVSVNELKFMLDGEEKRFVQIGTVMTDESYRKQGLCRMIMEQVEEEYKDWDGIYLFANDFANPMYRKLGYIEQEQYYFKKEVSIAGGATAEQVSMETKEDWAKFVDVIENSTWKNSRFTMIGNAQLRMFYLSTIMKENVFYIPDQDAFAVAEIEGDKLILHEVFSMNEVDLDEVIEAFGEQVKFVQLGFTPVNKEGYEEEIYKEEDSTLFVKGRFLERFTEKKLLFPLLSHA